MVAVLVAALLARGAVAAVIRRIQGLQEALCSLYRGFAAAAESAASFPLLEIWHKALSLQQQKLTLVDLRVAAAVEVPPGASAPLRAAAAVVGVDVGAVRAAAAAVVAAVGASGACPSTPPEPGEGSRSQVLVPRAAVAGVDETFVPPLLKCWRESVAVPAGASGVSPLAGAFAGWTKSAGPQEEQQRLRMLLQCEILMRHLLLLSV